MSITRTATKSAFACCWIPLILISATSGVIQADNYNYQITDDKIIITGYSGTETEISIPATIEGLPVTKIGFRAFYANSALTSVVIGPNVETIGDSAFGNCINITNLSLGENLKTIDYQAFWLCESLANISIPESVETIGDLAFLSCSNLTRMSIPSNVTHIGDWVFGSCSSLTNISVDAANQNYRSIDGVLFNKDATELISCPGGRVGNYVIPDSVEAIGVAAFESCTNLTSIVVSDAVSSIGNHAFYSCSSLTNISLPEGVVSIGNSAFDSCANLIAITIPSAVASVGDYAFYSCERLSVVFFEGGPPVLGRSILTYSNAAIAYYLPGRPGWDAVFFDGQPAVLWDAAIETSAGFGIVGDRFEFLVSGANGLPVVVRANDDVNGMDWTIEASFSLGENPERFSDSDLADRSGRFFSIGPH